jgi:hypothetical protein
LDTLDRYRFEILEILAQKGNRAPKKIYSVGPT